jgi:hypothetical protein
MAFDKHEYYRGSTFKVVQSRITLPLKSKLQAILATIASTPTHAYKYKYSNVNPLMEINANTRITHKGWQGKRPDPENPGQATPEPNRKDAQQG